MIKMFQASTTFGRNQQGSTQSASDELQVKLEMPGWSKGKTVSTGRVVAALLWQQYGLDVLHPEVSSWLEQNAPDVKYAVARNSNDSNSAQFRVESDGTVKVHLSLKVDDRLRAVSSNYILSQVGQPAAPQKRQLAAIAKAA
jgi:hypothetical protein